MALAPPRPKSETKPAVAVRKPARVEREFVAEPEAEADEVAVVLPKWQALAAEKVERTALAQTPAEQDVREGREPTEADRVAEAPAMRRARGPPTCPARALDVARTSVGAPLSSGLVDVYAARWGQDFTGVVVHTDAAAALAAALLGAEAFTVGEHVYFGAGRFSPGSPAGAALLAHELAHVVQLRAGQLVGVDGVSDPASGAEFAADAWVAARGVPSPVAESDAPAAVVGAPAAGAPVLRKATDTARDFFAQGYFQQAAGWSGASASVDGAVAEDAAADTEAFPDPTADLGPEQAPERPPVAAAPAFSAPGVIPGPGEAPATELEATATEASAPALPHLGALVPGADGDTSAARANLGGAMENVPTEFDVATSPGPPPPVVLDGGADPAQIEDQALVASEQAEALRVQAAAAVANGAGPEQVQPTAVHETHEVAPPEGTETEPFAEIEPMTRLVAAPIPEDVRAQTDLAGQEQLTLSMTEAGAAFDTAATDHDTRRETQITAAETEQTRLNDRATEQQNREVSRARGQIDGHRADTVAAQELATADLESQSSDERTRLQGEIDTRVAADQGRIDGQYAQAETGALAVKNTKEAEARAEKERAERESADQSWWEDALDAIGDFFDKLIDFVTELFDKLVEAVGAIIDAVKSAVTSIIDAVRDFAVGLVAAFGEFLKGLVDVLLGDLFPELAAALNELIDDAVQVATDAIHWVADQLKAGILALLDAIGAALTALLAAYKAALLAALAIARAALTGDWAALAKMVLEAALELAGIPPESFYEVANNAMSAIDTIIDDPGAFVGHVIDAVVLGFENFAGNFLVHLEAGFFAWIVGPLGELGLTLPASWDLLGVLGLAAQVFGLTQDGIRGVIVEELGETAGTIFDYVWRYVGALITGGLEGLWNQILADLSGLFDLVVSGIQTWLFETIVTQAVIRIAMLFNPVGALIQALMTVWNVYQWLRTNAQRIFGIVQAIVDLIGAIAAGNIAPAAAAVEGALAGLIPIAISLLANLFGLGGITARVREVLEGLRTMVHDAIRSLIRRVRALFRGGDEAEEEEPEAQGEGDADHEVGATVAFSGGGSHRLWLAVSGPTVTPTVASAAGPVATKLGEWEGQLRDDPTRLADHRPEGERLLADARGKLGDVQEEGNQAAQAEQQAAPEANPTPEEIAAADAQDVEAEQAEQTLAQVLGRLFELFGEVEADPRETYSAELGEMPLGAAAYASDQLGTLPPGVATTGWSEVKAWLRARPGFSGFMGENSRVGSGPGGTAQILKDAVTERVATITGPVPPEDERAIVARAKPKIESGVAPYTAARAAFETFVFSEAGRGSAQAETRTALSGNNEDVALVTNDLLAPEQALIDQWDQQVVRLQDSRTITGNARNLRKQYEGMLRSSNGLKYMFASGFRLQMQQVIASASTDPVRLRGVEVSVGDRRADYTEWMVGDLRLVVEVKNWTGQSRWTPEKTVELVNELFAQVADHLYAVRDADGHPLGGVRVEIRGGYPARLESLWPALEAHAAALPTVIPNRPKTLVRVVLP